jgi:hypothetical protein
MYTNHCTPFLEEHICCIILLIVAQPFQQSKMKHIITLNTCRCRLLAFVVLVEILGILSCIGLGFRVKGVRWTRSTCMQCN